MREGLQKAFVHVGWSNAAVGAATAMINRVSSLTLLYLMATEALNVRP